MDMTPKFKTWQLLFTFTTYPREEISILLLYTRYLFMPKPHQNNRFSAQSFSHLKYFMTKT